MQKIRDLLFFCGELFSCFIYLSVAAICISCSGKKINDSPPIDDSVITKNVSFKNGRDNVIGQDSLGICNEVVSRDTINIQTWLQKAESILNDYKHIHITNASDTLKYSNLDKKYRIMNQFVIEDFAPEELRHSVRVKYLGISISLLEEINRIHKEYVKIGLEGVLDENELKTTQEMMTLFKKKLWMETH